MNTRMVVSVSVCALVAATAASASAQQYSVSQLDSMEKRLMLEAESREMAKQDLPAPTASTRCGGTVSRLQRLLNTLNTSNSNNTWARNDDLIVFVVFIDFIIIIVGGARIAVDDRPTVPADIPGPALRQSGADASA